MSKVTLEKWREVSRDAIARKELLKCVSFLDLLDLVSECETVFDQETEKLKAARQEFIDDCKKRDQAIDQERANLQKEVSDQETRIRSLSTLYQKALGAGNVKVIPDLKKQIATATAARDEAQSTLDALEGVTVEYNRALYEKAEKAVAPVQTAKENLREVQHEVCDMREVLESLFRFDSEEFYMIRNAGTTSDLSRYDPQHWSDWAGKLSQSQPVTEANKAQTPVEYGPDEWPYPNGPVVAGDPGRLAVGIKTF